MAAVAPPEKAKPTATAFESVALLLQGGGALGAYQAGVYESLLKADVEPTWIAGIIDRCHQQRDLLPATAARNRVRTTSRILGIGERMLGTAASSGFWTGMFSSDTAEAGPTSLLPPRSPPGAFQASLHLVCRRHFFCLAQPWEPQAGTIPHAPATLERLVDFDLINAKTMRFSVGAVNVRTGKLCLFRSRDPHLGPEHIMASGALHRLRRRRDRREFYWDVGARLEHPA